MQSIRLTRPRREYVFCVTKFIVWKLRYLRIFPCEDHPSKTIISSIIKNIEDRIKADHSILKFDKFKEIWVKNKSFVKLTNNGLKFML